MSYMRKIVGRCYRVTTMAHYPRRIKTARYSVESREDVTTRTSFAWRLSCGHVLDGQQGHGKKSKICYKCQWLDERRADEWFNPEWVAEDSARWIDLADEDACEAQRLAAQS